MFGRIARRYDIANRLLSGGMDVYWRWRLVRSVRQTAPCNALDLATGSGDVAFALSRSLGSHVPITGMDFCPPMLEEANRKKNAAPAARYARVEFLPGDGLALPLEEAAYDAVTIAFGLRNLADRARGLAEMRRVLRPGGHLFVLEFSQPWPWIRPFYAFYLGRILPRIAGAVTGDRSAYDYLNSSIETFPARPEVSAEIRAAGFSLVQARGLTGGIVALHQARK